MKYNNCLEMLKDIPYSPNAIYNGKQVYPNTGSLGIDYIIFKYIFNYLLDPRDLSIDSYFHALDISNALARAELPFDEKDFIERQPKEIDSVFFDDTEHFAIKPTRGSIVGGYILICTKKHILSMSKLNKTDRKEYIDLLKTYRNRFYEIYGRTPIIFEHGGNNKLKVKSNSVDHAHTHMINHRYSNEEEILERMRFIEARNIEEALEMGKNRDYIFYVGDKEKIYITTEHNPESQIMRKYIANDVGLQDKWNWREYPFYENVWDTLKQFIIHSFSNTETVYINLSEYIKSQK